MSAGQAEAAKGFTATLSGDQEVPAVETAAQGTFELSKKPRKKDGGLDYRLDVGTIDNITAAHIHCAPAGENGAVGVTLLTISPDADLRLNGTLAQGKIFAPDPDNDCGWEDLDAVVDAVNNDNAYVNVHSADFPNGEIRGQIE
jgi:hypothetical protein